MAAATVIHFGEDLYFRLPVLIRAGYEVEPCDSIERFTILLECGYAAVLLDDQPNVPIYGAVTLTRARSTSPVVLFCHDHANVIEDHAFDLIVPPLTEPARWLADIALLLEQSGTIRAQSRDLHQKSSAPRKESAATRALTNEFIRRIKNDPDSVAS